MKIGLFFSRSGGVTDKVVDIDHLARHFSQEYHTFIVDDFFTPEGLRVILAQVNETIFDAVVLAGDSPMKYSNRKSADFVVNQLESTGINISKISFANIKEQVALAHPGQPQQATEKARILVEVAIEKVRYSHPIKTRQIAPHPAVALIGATPAAMLAAQRLLERNFKVYIIDTADRFRKFKGKERQEKTASVITYIEMNPMTRFLLNTQINDIYGYPGRFTLNITTNGVTNDITVGSIILANTADPETTRSLRPLVHIDVDDAGLFKPVNPDTLQVFTYEKGIFLLPDDEELDISYIVALSDSVAFAVTSFLEKREISYRIQVSEINEELCSGCGACVKTCMFKASSIDPHKNISIIDEQRCKGCGNCVTSCPTGARDLLTYPQKYLTKAIELLAGRKENSGPKILAFLCEGCGYQALDLAGIAGLEYDINVMPLGIRCGGNIDTQLILDAYRHGFQGIVICKCADTDCRNIVGNTDLDRRANLFREILRSRGIDSESLRIVEGLKGKENICVHTVQTLVEEIKNNGGGN
ncbi:hydrogenase iron-sulfur subunit [Phosphitispora fastidiosa]|uniref:hydrogenase iron-sulfur subunit n=1 Tax=Phosphitispora fastidiosa TaxID=2837202 RepID=UPI001E337702|nr:hydrogenase iron-sulfur subunit [Phosphitispora fastidiosa]MBU7007770.1 heterodisulfide reductase subunit A-like polyferredoxin/coenzyme F420-reducing hydrogenase delta subunit [Phosphitispora fastidiosa]